MNVAESPNLRNITTLQLQRERWLSRGSVELTGKIRERYPQVKRMVGSWGLEPQTSTPCQRPADRYAEQLSKRPGPPNYAEIRVRQSFNGTESGTEFPGRCFVFPVIHSSEETTDGRLAGRVRGF